ncbi:MAG: TonB-dependent receptor [Bacteroidales bacterium]|nr:TonB-dependent receptor [Bacteroidales bacterium]
MQKRTFIVARQVALAFVAMLLSTVAFAQTMSIKGKVVDNLGDAIIGVNVIEKGTTNGTLTDANGNFNLKVNEGATLTFSFIGYATQEIVVGNQTTIDVVLEEETAMLEDLVVVGYGVQKKSVVTAAIAKVSADDLTLSAPVRVDNALKGLASGVTVTSSSGQPGAAARIRVRGVGTINNSDPLYIVDGMPIEGGLDYLNPNDIQSIEVLKDAASGAVYGARAANGVILVTTKNGKAGQVHANYDFSYGWQSAWKHRDVLNASEYALMINEGRINAGMSPIYEDPYSYGEGTDWQDEVFNDNAPVMSHQASINGGNDKVNFLFSFGYYTQDGIVGGNFDRSNYERLTLRNNNVYNIFDHSKERNYLNSLRATSNISYARIKSKSIEANSTWGSPLGSALALSPILSVYDDEGEQLTKYAGNKDFTPIYSKDGRLYTIAGADYNEMVNPLASLSLPGDEGWSHKFVSNFSLELQLWDNLKVKSSFGSDLSFWGSDGITKLYYLTDNNKATNTNVHSSSERGLVWQLENVLMYDKSVEGHAFNVILGQSAKESVSYYLGGSRLGMRNEDHPYIDYCTGLSENPGEMNIYGGKNAKSTLASLFARVGYNYDERYMLQATIRRDGSSRFGSNNHYAVFPSFSVGWNLSNESFMSNRPEWFTSAKVRYSWGKNGNENIGNFAYVAMTSAGNNAIFGSDEKVYSGVKTSIIPNPDLKWEESAQTDIGIDLGFFNNTLTFTADYYKKKTDGMLMTMNIPSYVGESKPMGNVGKMENSGIEFELGYKNKFGDVNIHVSGNATYLKNKLVEYGNESGWANLDSFQGTGTISRAQNGKPFPYFFGYKTAGIYQNEAEASEGPKYSDGKSPKAGDIRFVDIDKNGIINDDDRTDIGKGMPDWTFGFNVGADWKGIDFSMMWQGTVGNDVYDATRRTDISATNLPSWMLGRWTGEGTSNKYPRFVLGDNYNWQSSDIMVYDGSYLRLKNIQLGYTLPTDLTQKVFISKFRVFVAAENLLTFTKYHGFDPEISSGGTSLGIDYGVYPQARVYTVGLNVAF